MPFELHEITFGSGRHKTHRAIVHFTEQAIIVLAIRHLAQRDIEPEDLCE